MTVREDEHGNLWVERAPFEIVVVWYSYGRVYTVIDGEQTDPFPTAAEAELISQAFAAISEYLAKKVSS